MDLRFDRRVTILYNFDCSLKLNLNLEGSEVKDHVEGESTPIVGKAPCAKSIFFPKPKNIPFKVLSNNKFYFYFPLLWSPPSSVIYPQPSSPLSLLFTLLALTNKVLFLLPSLMVSSVIRSPSPSLLFLSLSLLFLSHTRKASLQ